MTEIRYCGRCLSTFDGDPGACPNLACGANKPGAGWGVVLAEGDLLDRRYRVERCLAVGGAGLTYLAREVDGADRPIGPRVAIKVLYTARASGPFLRRLSTEAQILQELAHENIVELRGFVHRAGSEPYLVTRFEEGGSLAQHVERSGPQTPRVAAGVLRQVLLGLDVAHQRGVVHRDLKPDNVLLAEEVGPETVPRIRVADFGIAKVAGGMDKLTRMGAFVGTPEYAAPEQFEGQTPTPATDVFAAGALFAYLLLGHPPFAFSHRGDIETSYEELLNQLPFQLPPIAGADAPTHRVLQQVIDHTMVLDPAARWTIHQVLGALSPLVEVGRSGRNTLDVSVTPAPMRVLASQPPVAVAVPGAVDPRTATLPPDQSDDGLATDRL
ncbi:MAG: serine/threonine-protein kinase, partial [Myxococcota bacterium]